MVAAGSDWLVLQHIGQIAVTCTSNKRLVSVDCFCDIYTFFLASKRLVITYTCSLFITSHMKDKFILCYPKLSFNLLLCIYIVHVFVYCR